MCHSITIILCLGLLVPAILGDGANISKESQSHSNNEDTNNSDVKENGNIASPIQMNDLTPVQMKVMAVQDMIEQLKKYNAFWGKVSADKSRELIEENSEEIPEPEENPSEKMKRIKYVKKKNKKEEDENDKSDSVEESTGSNENEDQSDESGEVETQIREKGDVFNKKRLTEDASDLGKADYDKEKDFSLEQDDFYVDKESSDNGVKNFNTMELNKPSKGDRHEVEDAIAYRNKNNLSKKSENSEGTKSVTMIPTPSSTINNEQINKQDEFENQLKGQKEIAEPIMFRNRSDSHPTTQKPMSSLYKISKEFLMAKYLPVISMMRLKALNDPSKKNVKIPESDEDMSSNFDQPTPSFYEFRDETPEAPPYNFRREASQDMPSSDESYAVAELLDDDILNSKGSALVAPSSDEQGELKQDSLDLSEESNSKDFNDQSSEETLKLETIKNKDNSNHNEEDTSEEKENNENELRSSEQTKLVKGSGSLGRYHRIRDVSRTAAAM